MFASVFEFEFQFFNKSLLALSQVRSVRRSHFRLADSIRSSVDRFLWNGFLALDLVKRRRYAYIGSSTQRRIQKVQHLRSENRVMPAYEDEHLPRCNNSLRKSL